VSVDVGLVLAFVRVVSVCVVVASVGVGGASACAFVHGASRTRKIHIITLRIMLFMRGGLCVDMRTMIAYDLSIYVHFNVY